MARLIHRPCGVSRANARPPAAEAPLGVSSVAATVAKVRPANFSRDALRLDGSALREEGNTWEKNGVPNRPQRRRFEDL